MYKVTPNSFLSGKRCPMCSANAVKTNESFIEDVYELVGNEYRFLEKYVDAKTKILCKHNTGHCEHEWMIAPNSFLNGTRCPGCNLTRKRKERTHELYIQEVYKLIGDEYSVLEKYRGNYISIIHMHNADGCDYKWSVMPNSFLQGGRCPKCTGYSKTTNLFKEEIYTLVGNEYEVLGEYINAKTHIKMKHMLCNTSYKVAPTNFLKGNRCPQCNESDGERRVRLSLDNGNIKYKQEYSFDDLTGIGGNPLRFDFAIFDNADNLKLLVEYDGIFHFEKIYEDDTFQAIQEHDGRKNHYCKDNNIPLLRIPYWEFDSVEAILDKKLKYM